MVHTGCHLHRHSRAMVFGIYYNLARLRKKVEDSWSHIEDELQVRIILADKLIDATKRDVGQENSILQNVVEAQSWLEYSETVHETVQANNMLIVALEELFILLEDPDIAISKRLKNYLKNWKKMNIYFPNTVPSTMKRHTCTTANSKYFPTTWWQTTLV